MQNAEAQRAKSATQDLVPVQEVRDGVLVLPNGTLRAILIVSSLNFALKAEEEQNAIIYAFQEFLNSLDFPLQITVTSRRIDIDPYLEELKRRREQQANELLRLHMTEYINFVSELVEGNDIMTKSFFVVVSFSSLESRSTSWTSKLTGLLPGRSGKKRPAVMMTDELFEQNRKQLLQRAEQVAVGLRGVGLRVAPLQTQEVLELLYNVYNPNTSRNQRLHTIGLVQAEETDPQHLVAKVQRRRIPWVTHSSS